MAVGAEHRRRVAFSRGAALQLLDRRFVVLAEDLHCGSLG
jgi:hypothetical protein